MERTRKSTIKVAYLSYPYSKPNPRYNSDKVKKIAQEIITHREDLVLIVPHWAFDALFDFPTGYKFKFFGRWELEIISRCDMLILGCPLDEPNVSCGMIWEREHAVRLGIPVFSVEQVIKGADKYEP